MKTTVKLPNTLFFLFHLYMDMIYAQSCGLAEYIDQVTVVTSGELSTWKCTLTTVTVNVPTPGRSNNENVIKNRCSLQCLKTPECLFYKIDNGDTCVQCLAGLDMLFENEMTINVGTGPVYVKNTRTTPPFNFGKCTFGPYGDKKTEKFAVSPLVFSYNKITKVTMCLMPLEDTVNIQLEYDNQPLSGSTTSIPSALQNCHSHQTLILQANEQINGMDIYIYKKPPINVIKDIVIHTNQNAGSPWGPHYGGLGTKFPTQGNNLRAIFGFAGRYNRGLGVAYDSC